MVQLFRTARGAVKDEFWHIARSSKPVRKATDVLLLFRLLEQQCGPSIK